MLILLALALVAVGARLAFPDFTDNTVKAASNVFERLLERVAAPQDTSRSGKEISQQAHITALDGTVRVKKASSDLWVRADYSIPLEKGDVIQTGPEGMAKNVELVKTLRETLGDECEIMFDAYSGWDQDYALEWAKRVEQYRPFWMEEVTHPEKVDSFAAIRRGTSVPLASGEHFYGRWEVERYLQANTLNVVQADPEWCGGVSELVKIGTVASLHDVHVIPHGHSLRAAVHVILSQSPMTFPLGEYLVIKMRNYMHFEKNPMIVEQAHVARPTGPGFDIQLDESKIESQKLLTIS